MTRPFRSFVPAVAISIAAGCAVAAALYAWIGFWCLAVPVVVGAASATLAVED